MSPRTTPVVAALLLTSLVGGCTSTPTAATQATALPGTSQLGPARAPAPALPGVRPAPGPAPTATTAVGTPQRVAPTTAPGQGIAAGVNRADPDAVSAAVLTTFFTADTTTDQSPNAAAARAVALLTPAYATAVVSSPPVRGPGAQWSDWATRGVRLVPTLQPLPDDRPADSATTAYRIYLVTQTPTTANGQALAPVVVVAYVQLLATASGWAVANVDQR